MVDIYRNGKIRLPVSETSTCNHGVNIYRYRAIVHNGRCTYLNSGLLVAPREYVFHGLVPGVYWAYLWPPLTSMHLVATPNPVYNCLWQRFKFHPNVFCYLGGFSLMYKETSLQRYIIQGTHLYSSHYYYYSCPSLHFFYSPEQAGGPPFPLSVTGRSQQNAN